MKKTWIATELFYPEETSTSFILTKIANKLSEKYNVNVVCGDLVYDKKERSSSFTLDSKVFVHRIEGFKGDKNSLMSRSLRFIFLSFSIFLYLWKNVKKGEKVFMVTNPAPLILLISILKKFKKIELIILVHDVFPENTIPAGIIKSQKSLVYRILKIIFDKAYSTADKLITLGRDMQKVIENKTYKYHQKPQIVVIENWGEVGSIYPISRDEIITRDSLSRNKIVFQFAGNLGRVQGLMELLEIIKESKNDLLEFHFIGEGALKNELIDFTKLHNLSNVVFGGAYKREDQNIVLNSSDISIVTLSQGMFGLGVPSKTYNILAAGKPILYIGDENSEVDLLIKDHKIGYSFRNKEDILEFFNSIKIANKEILKTMGLKARQLAETVYSEEYILNRYKKEI